MKRVRFLLVFCSLASLFGAVTAGLPACDEVAIIYPCANPIMGRKDHTGHEDACCETDCCEGVIASPGITDGCVWLDGGADADAQEDAEAGPPADDAGPDGGEDAATDAHADAAPACPGACIDAPPLGWSDPAVLWLGAMGTPPPSCPTEAPVVGFQGFADLAAPPASCGACSCGEATATCALPSSLAVSSATCPGGGVTTPFDPPASWDGSCTNGNPLQANQMCGAVTCAKSLTTGPLVVQNEGCSAATALPVMPTPPATWQTAALACKRGSSVLCDDPLQVCAPVADVPPGFLVCVYQAGDVDCPASFPDKHAVAAGADDQRACSPCACGSPTGGLCVATLNVFTDDGCTAPLLSVPIGSTGPACFDLVPPGPALGSKTVDKVKYLPGACVPSGGEAIGQALPTGPATFCCRP
jgi:hypothetical protein